jgi:hypothetical protein
MQDEEFLDLFKPKKTAEDRDDNVPVEQSSSPAGDAMGATQPSPSHAPPEAGLHEADYTWDVEPDVERLPPGSATQGCSPRVVGMIMGGGCLVIILLAIIVFALLQIFGKDKDTPPTATPTRVIDVFTPPPPTPLPPVTESPLVVPLVSSGDVRVPIALPEQLSVGEAVFDIQAVRAPANTWPEAPSSNDVAAWAYGTVVNYVVQLASTPENQALLSALQVGDSLHLHMSTGLILNFNVSEISNDVADEAALFRQVSPRLTLSLPAGAGSASRTVVSAPFFDDEAGEKSLPTGTVAGLVGIPVDQGPVRVTVIETYQVAAGDAGLPAGMGYLLIDLAVENIGTTVLETEFFQSFVIDAAGERYPLTIPAGQFTHNGLPTDPLAPGEKVIGSAGYLLPDSPGEQVQWAFNPLPGSDHWVVVPLSFDLPDATPTPEPPPPVGFATVSIDPDNGVFVDSRDNLLIVGLEIENISEGVVYVTEDDISLTSTGGEFRLETAAPFLPWTIEAGAYRLFELHFELPSTRDALLDVLGYTFSIDNIGD